jgi:glycerate kinase
MKIIVAFDSFKNSLSAVRACEVVADILSRLLPSVQVIQKPMADGGEGTARAMIRALNGKWIPVKVMGPLVDMRVEAGFGWFEDGRTAVVEMACASGLELLTKVQMNPLKTTTYGSGELLKAAAEYGAAKILLAVGGSATVDGGTGAAKALGWNFLDDKGGEISLGGEGLRKLSAITKPVKFSLPQIEVLCDVDNPMCGERGAARVYGPQKGADPKMVEQLEENLEHLCKIVEQQFGKDINDITGAGAAGGLAGGAAAFMNAKLVSGVDTIIEHSHLRREMEDADWIITGEGSFDYQSLSGKVISGITRQASKTNCQVAVIAGKVEVLQEDYQKYGIVAATSCRKADMSLEYALENAEELLQSATQELVREYLATNWY